MHEGDLGAVAIVVNLHEAVDLLFCLFFFSSRRRHTRFDCDWSSDVCSSDLVLVADDRELPVRRGQARLRDAVHQTLMRQPVGHELRHRDEGERVSLGEPLQIGAPRHRAVGVQDLTDHARGIEPRQPREIDARLGLAHALQHAARTRPQGEHVTRPAQVPRHRGGIDGGAHRRRPVGGRDAGRDPEARGRVDRNGEGGFVRLGVVLGHLRETQRLAPVRHQRQTDEPAPVRREEIDHCRSDPLGGADQVPLVLAALVVGHDDELPRTDIRDGLFYGVLWHKCLTYFPSTSPSTCTRSLTRRFPSVVRRRVNGISATCTRSGPGSALIVKPTPSNVIDPCGTELSRTSRGTRRSYPHASPRRSARSTTATPSTCPCTMCPPRRSAARSARSRFTFRPLTYSPNRVRPAVVSITCTVNPLFTTRSTVRQAPFTAMLSPFFNPLNGARIVRVRPVSRFPVPVSRDALATVPTALTIPVNIAACPIPIMYPDPWRAAPPVSSAARPRGGAAARRERPERRLLRATPAPAPSTAGPPDRRRGAARPTPLPLRTRATRSRPRAACGVRRATSWG